MTKKSFIALLAALVVAAGWLIVGQAQIRKFYPASCLGGWDHPEHAKGEPDLEQGASPEEFTHNNAAVLPDNQGQLFCGQFEGVIPQDTRLGTVTLFVRWSAKDQPGIGSPLPPPSLLFLDEINASILNHGIPASVYRSLSDRDDPEASGKTEEKQQGIVQVLYTLDGSKWISLGVLEEERPERAMRVPLGTWEDVRTLQISVQQAQGYGGSAAVFLDGLWIEAAYESVTTH